MNAVKFWAVFTVGVAAGAAVALIYAPQSGEKTRRQLKRSFEDATDYLKDAADNISDHAEKYVKKGKDLIDDAVDSASNAVTAAKKVVQI
ncbi:YtxH domain-containing protein [Silvibacterium sp.]|uniref:YtxH domain-containing protein n=1 Tax=Silvibacterium sp. TaxID=1964179 RepID=UPI0039E34374